MSSMYINRIIFCILLTQLPCFHSVDEELQEELEIRRQEWAERSHKTDSLSLLVFSFLLIITLFSIWFLKHKSWRYVHETGLSLIYGIIVGAIVRYGAPTNSLEETPPVFANESLDVPPDIIHLKIVNFSTWAYRIESEVSTLTGTLRDKVTFDPEIFFNVFLPPIIFNAGFSMKKVHFFSNFGSILVYSFVGTTISSFVVGSITYAVSLIQSSVVFSFAECLFFGAIISATDPVTVLALFSDLGVDPHLYSLVFGESALNDAVAIVLSETIEGTQEYKYSDTASSSSLNSSAGSVNEQMTKTISFSALDALNALGSFVTIFVGSWALGVLIGVITAFLTKFMRSLHQHPMIETSLFLILSHCSYLIAESVGFTGIVSLLFCGVTQAHYTYYNLSLESRRQTKQLFEFLSFLSENFIFLYMGITVFSFPSHQWNYMFILGALVGIIVGRAANIYPLTFLINLARREPHKISFNFQHMLMFSGLRGAIAFALAIRNTSTSARQSMLTTTLLIVIITVICCGSFATKVLELLHIRVGVKEDDSSSVADDSSHRSGVSGGSNASNVNTLSNGGANSSQHYDENFNNDKHFAMGSIESDGERIQPRIVNSQRKENMHPISASWYDFDRKYIKPILTVNQGHPLYLTFPQPWCQPIVRYFSKSRDDDRGGHARRNNRDREEEQVAYGKSTQNGTTRDAVYGGSDEVESDTDIILENVGEIATSEIDPASAHPDLHSVVTKSTAVSSNPVHDAPIVAIAPPPSDSTSPKRGPLAPPPGMQNGDQTTTLEL
ncbi:sodium/hydrogen exchanger 9-like isoform X2 [Symsagittifera roscoffensis]|uniref:sodium/hydrogen exchanger 9-like isoform X2 n=1 Tax=Symsagittifera roscoffensis TaxID=84072 RepID=UPI00307C3AFD